MNDPTPVTDREFVRDHNARHVFHPMAAPNANERNPPLVIARGDGVRIWDSDGREYLDLTAGLWCVNVGHNRAEIKQAIAAQLDQIAYYATFGNISNPPAIRLSARLVDLLAPERVTRVFFSSGGSDANETSIKLARQFWRLEGKPEKTKIVSLRYGYHGVHFGGMSAGGNPQHRRAYEPLLPGFFQVEAPYLYRNPWTNDPAELARICAGLLEREIQHQGADTVAAFLAEPIQGAGGLIIPPAEYWPLVRAICDRNDVLLISDEIVTGFGRTGHMFGARGWGVKPDIMNLAKGINSAYVPLGATALSERVASAWNRDHPLATIMHGYTYSGHPVACAAALANLEVLEREDLTGNAARVGAYFLERLQELREYPQVGDVRGRGLMLGAELVIDRTTKEPLLPAHPDHARLYQAFLAESIMPRMGGNKIMISPPLVFTRANVDEAMLALHRGFKRIR